MFFTQPFCYYHILIIKVLVKLEKKIDDYGYGHATSIIDGYGSGFNFG
jgi:hypothetical protein